MNPQFPNLAAEGFSITSPESPDYNCIAWAAGHDDRWWWPDPSFSAFWPLTAPRLETVAAFVEAFRALGYQPCDNAEWEPDFEKVSLYARDGKPTHAARQLRDGNWTSKLGRDIDVTHTLRGLEGPEYGTVASLLKRAWEYKP